MPTFDEVNDAPDAPLENTADEATSSRRIAPRISDDMRATVTLHPNQMSELKDHLSALAEQHRDHVSNVADDTAERPVFSDDQFARLEELLQPGYEVSKKLLEQLEAKAITAAPVSASTKKGSSASTTEGTSES